MKQTTNNQPGVKDSSVGQTSKGRNALTMERENYLNELIKIHGTDAESLHTCFVGLSDIFEGLTIMIDVRIEDIMDRMRWAYDSYIDKHRCEAKDVLQDYGEIYRLMMILSRNEKLIHELKYKCDDLRDDLEKIAY